MNVYIPDLEASDRMGLAEKLRAVPNIQLRIGNFFRADANHLVDTVADAEVLCVALGRVTREVIEAAPRLRLIVKCGIGTDNIDVVAANSRGVDVVRTAGVNFEGVAEFVIGVCIAYYRQLVKFDGAVRLGAWDELRRQSAGLLPGLAGRTIGIVGVGAIGRELARLALAHRMNVLGCDPFIHWAALEAMGVASASLDDVLTEADIVSLHVVLTESTRHLISGPELSRMKSTALLVNTSRGPIVDEKALVDALRSRSIGGALLDVYEIEPPVAASPLFEFDNCVLSPHLAGCTDRGYVEIGSRAAGLVEACLNGSPLPVECLVRG